MRKKSLLVLRRFLPALSHMPRGPASVAFSGRCFCMKFKKDESVDKLRGGYYTPDAVAKFLVKWATKGHVSSILEPSCGDGAFIRALKSTRRKISVTGVELVRAEAAKARTLAKENPFIDASILNRDFLEWAHAMIDGGKTFDAVMGNPPYIRYQYLDERDQVLSAQIFGRHHLAFTKHTNAWVPFVIASLDLLKAGHRLAMVIPSELLHVLHAGSLREFLLQTCSRILLIDPNELLFDAALQGTVLLMAEKKVDPAIPSRGVAVVAAPNNDFLTSDPESIFSSASFVSGTHLEGKWMKALLAADERRIFEKVQRLPAIKRFSEVASVDVGIVTGANKFFLVPDETVSAFGLEAFAHPMFGRSEHCPGVIYDERVHRENAARGFSTNFLMFDKTEKKKLPAKVQEYIRFGESQNLHTRYKCSTRKPWFRVPSVYRSTIGMLKRSHHFSRLILNELGAYTTDTAYRISTDSDPASLVYCFVNSLTALTAELEGRHYGGGVLELVPSEIERLCVPMVHATPEDLRDLDQRVSAAGDPAKLLRAQDRIVLRNAGVSEADCRVLHRAWVRIRSRRQRLLSDVITTEQGSTDD